LPRSSSRPTSSTSINFSSVRRWSEGAVAVPRLHGYARLKRVNVRTYDTGVVFLHYEPQR
jgi:hypothetical protein